MTWMHRNQRQGALAELDVARDFMKQGCAVNALTQMDFGVDMHLQLPLHQVAGRQEKWEMSQADARVQVKSTRQATPSFTLDRELVARWAPSMTKTSPVFLVICWVHGRETKKYLFTPEDFHVARDSSAASTTFTGSTTSRVTPTEMLRRIDTWSKLAPLADTLENGGVRPPSVFGLLDRVAAAAFIDKAVMSWVEAHVSLDDVTYRGGVSEAASLARSMAAGLGIDDDPFEWEQHVTALLSNATTYRKGWAENAPHIAVFTAERDKESAHDALIELARLWGFHRLRATPARQSW